MECVSPILLLHHVCVTLTTMTTLAPAVLSWASIQFSAVRWYLTLLLHGCKLQTCTLVQDIRISAQIARTVFAWTDHVNVLMTGEVMTARSLDVLAKWRTAMEEAHATKLCGLMCANANRVGQGLTVPSVHIWWRTEILQAFFAWQMPFFIKNSCMCKQLFWERCMWWKYKPTSLQLLALLRRRWLFPLPGTIRLVERLLHDRVCYHWKHDWRYIQLLSTSHS